MKAVLLSVATVTALCVCLQVFGAKGDRPVDVFAGLEGKRQGTFVGYDATGRDIYSIDGMGKYGDNFILMHGRYHRIR